jgi:fumarate reductase flavoprotein subunit
MSGNIKSDAKNLQANIVVVGGGGAGLTAVVTATEAGAKNIIVLEKAARPGGNTSLSGCIFAVNSPLQRRLDINVSADEVFREKIAHAEWRINARLLRNWIDKSGDIMRWLEEKGMEFKYILPSQPGAPKVAHDFAEPGRHPGATGRALIETLSKECQRLGVKVLCDAPAKKIFTDEKGKVSGVLTIMKNKEVKISTKSVILATGGFGGNKEMINKYFPSHGDLPTGSLPQMTGDGLIMAEEVGAIIDDQLSILLLGPGHEGAHSLGMLLRRPDMMVVNKDGERYYDESAQLYYNPDDVSNTVSRQRDKTCYALLDSKIKQAIIQNTEAIDGVEAMQASTSWRDTLDNDFQKDAAEGKAKMANSWDEIAEFIGAKSEFLKTRVEQYNSFCDNGYDDDFLKDPKYLRPLRTPPYYAIKGRPFFNTTFGGIKINQRMEVLDKHDIAIGGLYAAGDNAGSWAPATYSHRYPGSAVSFALYSGYFAGENAAEYVSGKG